MTNPDRKKFILLAVLLTVLVATLYLGFRSGQTPDQAVAPAGDSKPVPVGATGVGARLRMELVTKAEGAEDLGNNNLFQYRTGRGAAAAPASGQPPPAVVAPAMPAPGPAQPSRPPVQPPPPPIPLKYLGFASIGSESRVLVAMLSDDTQQRNFSAAEGEIWLGRYRIARITDSAVEIEDLDLNRKQSLPLIKQ